MKLSDELISQLVKVTNDRPERKTDAVVYGTIVEDGSKQYVRLDGSDVLTPFETTVEVNKDDRVSVSVQNHTAMVTGNVSDPSVGTKTADGLRSSITQTADEIRLEVEDLNNNLSSTISQTANAIRSEVSAVETGIRTDFDAVSAELDSKITQTASSIKSEVSASVTGLDGKITNLNSKVTQNATSITSLVKNQDDFSEFKQTVEGFSFMNKGGTVKIGSGNLNLTGAITFTDLNGDVSGKINTATTTANSANSTASSALSTANSALSKANSAESTADSAYAIASANTNPYYITSSYIDGATIKSPTIEGNEIKVHGTFQTIGTETDSEGNPIPTGFMGAAHGLGSDDIVTSGVALARTWDPSSDEVSNSYVIVTNGGVRLQYNNNCVVVSAHGITIKTPGYASDGGKCIAKYNDKEIATVDNVGTITAVWG